MASLNRPSSLSGPDNIFPIPLYPVSEIHDAPSIISSRMTDIASDDGYEDNPEESIIAPTSGYATARPATRSSAHDQSHDQSFPTSRPSTAATGTASRTGAGWSQSPPSRRSYQAMSGSSTAAKRQSGVVRPTSSASRTHVPSITSHAFFRPMSSQRLQAQRAQRSTTMVNTGAGGETFSETASTTNRHSIGSNPISRRPGGTTLSQDNDLPPRSRDTINTHPETPDRDTANTSPSAWGTMRSMSDSVTPLQGRSANMGLKLNTRDGYNGASDEAPAHRKSPKSFRSNFLPGSRSTAQSRSDAQRREKLSSAMSSPESGHITGDSHLAERDPGKNYHYFPGNTVFCFGGRLQNTRHRPVNIITGLFVLIPGVLFLAFSAPWLGRNVSLAIPILFAYIFFICMSSFIHASASDPGILPRNLHAFPPAPESDDPLTLGPATTGWTTIRSYSSSRTAMEVPTKYCKTCNIWRPPRAHHCRICDNCIETQDHHCVWLNNCVGRRNYRYFFTFVASGTLIGLFLLGASLAHILLYRQQQHISFGEAVDIWRVPFAMVIYGAIATPYPSVLWAYHTMLIARGDTTREYLNSHKFAKQDRHRPFTQDNMFKNWVVVLCRPRPPTYLQFKRPYERGDQRLGSKRIAHIKDAEYGGAMELTTVSRDGERKAPVPHLLRDVQEHGRR